MQVDAANDPVVAAACGVSHSVLLTVAGRVYTAGSNDLGQCGQGLDLQQVRPCLRLHILSSPALHVA